MSEISIVGGGWSGLLLADTLTKMGIKNTVYERSKSLKAICACGIVTDSFREIAKKHDLNADDYIQWESKKLIMDFNNKTYVLYVKGLCTFDKQRFMEDLKVPVVFGQDFRKISSHNRIVDATGTREVLGHLLTDKTYVTYQVKVRFNGEMPYKDFYMHYPKDSDLGMKYLWLFPLSEKEAYVGCGALSGTDACHQVEQFLAKYPGLILEKKARQLRLGYPQTSMPIQWRNKVAGVGNCIGAITAWGEGNEWAAYSTDLLAENIDDFSAYEREITAKLGWLEKDYKAYSNLANGKVYRCALHMMTTQRKHYGMGIPEILKTVKSAV